ncbi:MAG: PH domain-containing protein [Bacillota bacterium]
MTWILLPGILVAIVIAGVLSPPDEGWLTLILAGLLPIALVGALTIWIWYSTGYTVTDQEVIVRSAFLIWRVPLAEVTRVRRTGNPLSSPALSLNRLEVRWGKGRWIIISPADQAEFLQVLRQRCPQADIQE